VKNASRLPHQADGSQEKERARFWHLQCLASDLRM
jgi:hypothetical protein